MGAGYETLLTADYSQIEMRIMAHLSEDPGLVEAFNSGEDLHRFVGARVFGVAPEDVTPAMRTKVKAMSYGLVYGLSAFGLSKQLRIEQTEAKQLMMEYFARFGAVRDYLRSSVEQAKIDGYTETIFGRRRPFPDSRAQPGAARERRACGAQRADPGQRRRHHEDRAVPHPRDFAENGCAPACCCRSTTSSSSRSRRGSGMPRSGSSASGWAARPS